MQNGWFWKKKLHKNASLTTWNCRFRLRNHMQSMSIRWFNRNRSWRDYSIGFLRFFLFWKHTSQSHVRDSIWFQNWTNKSCARKLYFSIVVSFYLSGGVLLAMMINLALPWRNVFKVCLYPKQNLPDFMTKAKRALVDSKAFFCCT